MTAAPNALTEAVVIDALRPVQDPELHRSIVDLGMVRDVVVDGTAVSLTVVLTIPGCPLKGEITNRVNGRFYVGSTVNLARRWQDHW